MSEQETSTRSLTSWRNKMCDLENLKRQKRKRRNASFEVHEIEFVT